MVQVAERERKLDELQRRVRLRAAKGGLTRVRSQTPGRRGGQARVERGRPARADAADSRISSRPCSVDDDAELDQDPPADVLDPSTRRQIRVAARASLGCRDLYDALGVPRDAPASYIVARADAERQRWMKKAQVTAEKTAWLESDHSRQSHLSSPKARPVRSDLGPGDRGVVRGPGRVCSQGVEAGSTRARSRP